MKRHFKRNKKLLLSTIAICSAVVITTMSSKDNEDGPFAPFANDPKWEVAPPTATKVVVQKMDRPLATGENMLLQITYAVGAINGTSITMYVSDDEKIILNDDGINGDLRAKDNVFTAQVKEELDAFAAAMSDFDRTLSSNNGNLLVFKGRTAQSVQRRSVFFDKTAFDGFRPVEISADIFSLPPVTSSNTVSAVFGSFNGTNYNGTVVSNPVLPAIPAATRGSGPPPPPPTILKQNSLLITNLAVVEDPARTFNPCTKVGNVDGAWTFKTLMKGLANQTFTGVTAKELTKHWVRRWTVDTTVNGEFVRNRATRAISLFIKPWLDKARGTTLPTVTLASWQGIWDGVHQDSILKYAPFHLTAIVNRLDLRGNFGYAGSASNAGETRFIYSVIRNTSTGNCRDSISGPPFDGFNIIFEYGNVQKTCTQVKAFALQWANLSTMVLGSAAYNAALEAITHTVTDSNVVTNKPNKSALNQLRTNEIAMTNTTNSATDRSPRWQFREFKLQTSNNRLEQVPTANEPAGKFNGADGGALADVTVMSNWVNSNSTAIKAQTLAVPLSVTGAPNFQAGKVNYRSPSATLASGFWDGLPGAPITDDTTRHVFSLNTCTGCHSMDPKTVFTHVNYVGFGTAMNYQTTLNVIPNGTEHKTHISPFLTGVDVIPNGGGTFIFGDDSTSVAENATDNTLTGLFWARDAANRNYPGTGIVRKWGFNDLQRRSQDLTNLLNSICSVKSISAANIAFFKPLNMTH
jgi:hypothetical protein